MPRSSVVGTGSQVLDSRSSPDSSGCRSAEKFVRQLPQACPLADHRRPSTWRHPKRQSATVSLAFTSSRRETLGRHDERPATRRAKRAHGLASASRT